MNGGVSVGLAALPAGLAPALGAAVVVAGLWAAGFLSGASPRRVVDGGPRRAVPPEPDRRVGPGRLTAVGAAWASASDPDPARPPSALVVAVMVLVGGVALVIGPAVAVGGAALVGAGRVRSARRHRSRQQRSIDTAVPDLVDLFRVAAAAGHPVASCLRLVAPRSPAAVQAALVDAQAAVDRGRPLARVLADLGPRLGTLGPALTGALAGSAATGAPLVPALDRVSFLARDRRRRDAETRARRLPVTMLFPLVACVLPAFVLLAVVPLVVAALASLRL